MQWSMLAQGVTLDEKPEPITEDLQTLLKANRMVKVANNRSQKRIDKIVKENGKWKGSCRVQMTIADKGIATLYVAANFIGDNPNGANVLAMHGDNVVFCLNKYCLQDEDEE